jgi:hypothetical protein
MEVVAVVVSQQLAAAVVVKVIVSLFVIFPLFHIFVKFQ